MNDQNFFQKCHSVCRYIEMLAIFNLFIYYTPTQCHHGNAVKQDKKAQIALTVALRDTNAIHTILLHSYGVETTR